MTRDSSTFLSGSHTIVKTDQNCMITDCMANDNLSESDCQIAYAGCHYPVNTATVVKSTVYGLQ